MRPVNAHLFKLRRIKITPALGHEIIARGQGKSGHTAAEDDAFLQYIHK